VVDNLPPELANCRPDIIAVGQDGTIDLVEVASKTDDPEDLLRKVFNIEKSLGVLRGKGKVLLIPDLFKEGMSLYGS